MCVEERHWRRRRSRWEGKPLARSVAAGNAEAGTHEAQGTRLRDYGTSSARRLSVWAARSAASYAVAGALGGLTDALRNIAFPTRCRG